jgi:cellulose synthase/poly-beta-1,6-N-acetylglucosamine synthase-like glycosyltransferase
MQDKYVTIIIPAYKDWERLSLCLAALSKQSYPAELFEIIVVNNDPTEDIPDQYFFPQNCILIKEAKPGSYAARNAALKIARGEIIGFTDSDCIPDKDWIKNAIEYFSQNKLCTRIAGEVSIFFKSPQPTKAELYDKLYGFNQSRYVTISGTSVTANLFAYKYVFDAIGFFDENLMSGGDFRWGMLAHKAGYPIDYVKNILVNHPARYSWADLIKKEKRIGGGQAYFSKRSNSTTVNFFRFLKSLWPSTMEFNHIKDIGKDLSLNKKIHFYLIRHYLHSIRAYERFRVQSGKKAKRD